MQLSVRDGAGATGGPQGRAGAGSAGGGAAGATLMTMDLYGHLMDANLREAPRAIGGILGASEPTEQQDEDADDAGSDESAW